MPITLIPSSQPDISRVVGPVVGVVLSARRWHRAAFLVSGGPVAKRCQPSSHSGLGTVPPGTVVAKWHSDVEGSSVGDSGGSVCCGSSVAVPDGATVVGTLSEGTLEHLTTVVMVRPLASGLPMMQSSSGPGGGTSVVLRSASIPTGGRVVVGSGVGVGGGATSLGVGDSLGAEGSITSGEDLRASAPRRSPAAMVVPTTLKRMRDRSMPGLSAR